MLQLLKESLICSTVLRQRQKLLQMQLNKVVEHMVTWLHSNYVVLVQILFVQLELYKILKELLMRAGTVIHLEILF
jgi:hypothetical protein